MRLLFWRLENHLLKYSFKDIIWTFSSYVFSFGTSFAKSDQLGMENNCSRQTDENLYIDIKLSKCLFLTKKLDLDTRHHCFKSSNIPITEGGQIYHIFMTAL